MTWPKSPSKASSWSELSGVQILVWPIVIVFMLQTLLAGGLETGHASLLSMLALDHTSLSVWAAGALGPKGVLQNGEWWRLVSPMFLHFSVLHLVFNMLALVSLGRIVEQLYGRSGLILAFMVTGLAGVITPFLWAVIRHQSRLDAGASGAVCGLLGLLLAHMRQRQDEPARFAARSLMRWTIFLAIWSLFPGISLASHAGGFVAGYLLARALPAFSFQSRRIARLALLLGLLGLAALTTGGLGAPKRLQEALAASELRGSAWTAWRAISEGQPISPGIQTGVRLIQVPVELKPAQRVLLAVLKDETLRGPEARLRLMGVMDAIVNWHLKHDPDLLVRPGSGS